MIWNTIDRNIRWGDFVAFDQSDYLDESNYGICYGLCRGVIESNAGNNMYRRDFDGCYNRIAELFGGGDATLPFVNRGAKLQVARNQRKRKWVSFYQNLETYKLYILGVKECTPGYCTRYSLGSYLTYGDWSSNHAVLIGGTNDRVLVFDPNVGLCLYQNVDITKLSYTDLGRLVENLGGRRQDSVYVQEIEE
jgi:hypothetical protein